MNFFIHAGMALLMMQWAAHPTPNVPKLPDGKPNLNGPAPKTADGKPDLSGIWENVRGQRGQCPACLAAQACEMDFRMARSITGEVLDERGERALRKAQRQAGPGRGEAVLACRAACRRLGARRARRILILGKATRLHADSPQQGPCHCWQMPADGSACGRADHEVLSSAPPGCGEGGGRAMRREAFETVRDLHGATRRHRFKMTPRHGISSETHCFRAVGPNGAPFMNRGV